MKTKTKPNKHDKPGKFTVPTECTNVIYLLDRSGSMASLAIEVVSGFNSYIAELKKSGKPFLITLRQFDSSEIQTTFDAVPIARMRKLDGFNPGGFTPLYDAIGSTIEATARSQKPEARGQKNKVLFVIVTDGLENASTEYTLKGARDLIKQKEKDGWTFAFLGVGPGGWGETVKISKGTQSASNVSNISHNPKAMRQSYQRLATGTVAYSGAKGGQVVQGFWGGKDEDHENQ